MPPAPAALTCLWVPGPPDRIRVATPAGTELLSVPEFNRRFGPEALRAVRWYGQDAAPRGPAHILLVDDNPLDVELTLLALASCGLDRRVSVAVDGQDALDFLYVRGRHAARPPGLPTLLLLDLKMPGLDGRAVLRQVRAHPDGERVHVAILTTSGLPEDRAGCEAADAYLVKPLDLDEFARVVGETLPGLLRRTRQGSPS